mgnify:FL=1
MLRAKPAETYLFVSQRPERYFEIEPPPRTIDAEILGPLELSPAEREWVNAVLQAIVAIHWPSGWIRSDEIGQLEIIMESVIHVHLGDDRLRENFPRSQWRRGLPFEQPLVHMLCRRANKELTELEKSELRELAEAEERQTNQSKSV